MKAQQKLKWILCLVFIVSCVVILQKKPPELIDDGAFYFRYAQNMYQREFWVWNIGDAPTWGASAPLFPLLLSIPLWILTPLQVAIFGGALFYSITLSLMFYLLARNVNIVTASIFWITALLNASLQNWFMSGMETPMTILLLTLCYFFLVYNMSHWKIILLAMVLMIHKIDLIPIAFLFLLLVEKNWKKRIFLMRKSLLLAWVWYGFAWLYFGSPIPNSFLTKLFYQQELVRIIDEQWFGQYLFLHNSHLFLSAFALLGIQSLWKKQPKIIVLQLFSLGIILIHLTGYTLYPPFEPYNWYAMPSLWGLLILSALGLGQGIRVISQSVQQSISVSILLLFVLIGYPIEERHRQNWFRYLNHIEKDRADSGRWVAENTSKNVVVLTGWGNPALYSQRKIIDSSFLQQPFQNFDLIEFHQPEIIIAQGMAGSSPEKPHFLVLENRKDQYRLIQIFDTSYREGEDFYIGILRKITANPQPK